MVLFDNQLRDSFVKTGNKAVTAYELYEIYDAVQTNGLFSSKTRDIAKDAGGTILDINSPGLKNQLSKIGSEATTLWDKNRAAIINGTDFRRTPTQADIVTPNNNGMIYLAAGGILAYLMLKK